MSIYDSETKIYPDLNPTAPQVPQTFQLQKLTEIEPYLLNEIEAYRRQIKQRKQSHTIIGIIDTSPITSSAIAGGAFIPAFASSIGVPVGAALG